MIVGRKENGKLGYNSLDFEIFIGDLFEECKNLDETCWLEEQLIDCVQIIADERKEDLEDGDE